MTDEPEVLEEQVESTPIPGVDYVVSHQEIVAARPEEALKRSEGVDCDDLRRVFTVALGDADEAARRVLGLLTGLTNYHFVASSRTEPFRPMWTMGDRRTLVPTDLLKEQINELAAYAPSIVNHGLRARIADVVWFSDRRNAGMGFLAVSSYCDCIDAVKAGAATLAFEECAPHGKHAVGLLTRAAVIAFSMGWDKPDFDRVRALISSTTEAAFRTSDPAGFLRIATLDLERRVTSAAQVAAWTEQLAASESLANDPFLREELWETAARAFHIEQREDEEVRCRIAAAECCVDKAAGFDSAMAQASHLQHAIERLRELPGTRARRDALHEDLRHIQRAMRDEMGTFGEWIDLTDTVEHARATVKGRSLPTALWELFTCDRAPDPNDLRESTLRALEGSPLFAMIPMTMNDHQGRLVFRSPGWGDAECSEEHARCLMARARDIHRHLTVSGTINPIRRIIADEHSASLQELSAIVQLSPFVAPGHEHIFARGLFRFLGGEDLEAASLLFPQLENSLRHVLSLKGIDTTTMGANGLQKEESLSQLLERHRTDLEDVFGAAIVHEIDMIFDFRGGPSLRNEMAHGKMPAGAFWSHNAIYGSWFILHLVLVSLRPVWDKVEAAFALKAGLSMAAKTETVGPTNAASSST